MISCFSGPAPPGSDDVIRYPERRFLSMYQGRPDRDLTTLQPYPVPFAVDFRPRTASANKYFLSGLITTRNTCCTDMNVSILVDILRGMEVSLGEKRGKEKIRVEGESGIWKVSGRQNIMQ